MSAEFFVDENDIALGRLLEERFGGVVFPGHPDLPEVPRQTLDEVWLPLVGDRRLVVITRDQRIRRRPVEKAAWVTHRVRGFVLTGKASQSTQQSLVLLQQHWDRMLITVGSRETGPWMYSVTRSGVSEIALS